MSIEEDDGISAELMNCNERIEDLAANVRHLELKLEGLIEAFYPRLKDV